MGLGTCRTFPRSSRGSLGGFSCKLRVSAFPCSPFSFSSPPFTPSLPLLCEPQFYLLKGGNLGQTFKKELARKPGAAPAPRCVPCHRGGSGIRRAHAHAGADVPALTTVPSAACWGSAPIGVGVVVPGPDEPCQIIRCHRAAVLEASEHPRIVNSSFFPF